VLAKGRKVFVGNPEIGVITSKCLVKVDNTVLWGHIQGKAVRKAESK
jgi:hypothetical protein